MTSRSSEGIQNKVYDENGQNVTPKPLIYESSSKRSLKSRDSNGRFSNGPPSVVFKLSDSSKPPEVVSSKDILEAKDYVQALALAKKNIQEKRKVITKSAPICTFTILLQETETLCLLNLQSMNIIRTSDEDYNTIHGHDKTASRYLADSFVQTFNPVQKKKLSQTIVTRYNTSCVFASEWDLYDTYRKLNYETGRPITFFKAWTCDIIVNSNTESDGSIGVEHGSIKQLRGREECFSLTTNLNNSSESNGSKLEGQQSELEKKAVSSKVKKIFRLPGFKCAVVVAERLLASNIFHQEQATFMSPAVNQDCSSFHYVVNRLWAFSYSETVNRNVTAISWNTANTNIVAVGYGKYLYKDNVGGLVCCWSVKNPSQPERAYHMDAAVTTISFSKTHPNLLAVGCYDGSIIVLNITTITGEPLKVNRKINDLQYGPVWKVKWFNYTDYVIEREEIISVGQNGNVYKWNHKEEACCYILMKLNYSPPILKFKAMNKRKEKKMTEVSRKHLSALSISLHPRDRMVYYIGTQQGCVVKCVMNHQEQFVDVFPAHSGPVYNIIHSPFSSNIFLTYGSDRMICLWSENLNEPLLRLYWTKAPIEGAAWSPTYSTILASVSGNQLAIWDIGRKIIVPISIIRSPSGRRFSCVEFSSTGKNILAGDMEGQVHVFNLKDMPYAPFLQEEALTRALEKALVSKPEIIKKLKNKNKIHF